MKNNHINLLDELSQGIVINNDTNYKVSQKSIKEMVLFFSNFYNRGLNSLDITIVHDSKMSQINQDYLNHEGSTDIITFEYEEDLQKPLNGELIICKDEAKRNAKIYGVSLKKEFVRLVFHGLLHLNGYDDKSSELRKVMKEQEDLLVKMWFEKDK